MSDTTNAALITNAAILSLLSCDRCNTCLRHESDLREALDARATPPEIVPAMKGCDLCGGPWPRTATFICACGNQVGAALSCAVPPAESRSAEPTDRQEIARCLYLTDRQIYDRTYGGMEGETWETAPATSRAHFEKYAAAILARGFHRSALAHPEARAAQTAEGKS